MANPKNESPLAVLAKIAPPPALDGIPNPGKATVAAIVAAAGYATPKATITGIDRLQAEWDKCQAGINANTTGAARRDFRAQNEKLGRGEKIEGDVWTEAEFNTDYEIRRNAFKAREHEVSQEAFALCRNDLCQFAEKVDAVANQNAAAEAVPFEKFAVKYEPSDLVLAVMKFADSCRATVRNWSRGNSMKPKGIAAFLPQS